MSDSKIAFSILAVIGGIIITALIIAPSYQSEDIFIIESGDSGNGTDTTDCINLGSQYQIVLNSTGGDCYIRSLANGTNITITTNSTHLTISSSASGGMVAHMLLNSTFHSDTVTNAVSRGSLIYGDQTPKWNELTIGTAGKYFRSNGTDASWSYYRTKIFTTSDVLTLNDNIALGNAASGDVIISLPDFTITGQIGKEYFVKKTDSTTNLVRLAGNGRVIDGAGEIDMRSQNQSILVAYDGGSWKILASHLMPRYIYENNTASNLGSVGEGIFAQKSGVDLQFKKLLAGTGITLSSNGTRITITNSSPESTTCNNVGTGVQLCSGGNINVDTLIAGTGISITDTTDDFTIANTAPELQIAQQAGDVYSSLTKTNIGTGYIDIYVTAFDEEDMMVIDCANVTYAKVVYIWDYVGTGNQQVRWVDASDNGNVFYESPTFTADRDATDSGFFSKPSWCTTTVTLEWQGKSTVAGDDPVAKGYKIMVK